MADDDKPNQPAGNGKKPADGKPAPAPAAMASPMSNRELREQQFPTWMTIAAIICGALLLAYGLAMVLLRDRLLIQSNLTIAIGLALIVAAFGTRAKVQHQNFYIIGSGAIALIFFGALSYAQRELTPATLPNIEGSISGNFVTGMREINVIGVTSDRSYGRWENGGRFWFYLPGQDIDKLDCLQIDISGDPPPGTPETIFMSVDGKNLRSSISAGKPLTFYYRGTTPGSATFLYPSLDGGTPYSTCSTATGSVETPGGGPNYWPSFIATALAGFDIASLLKDLQSGDTIERRGARDALVTLGLDAVRPLFDALHADPQNYRLQIGTSFVIWQMLDAKGGGVASSELRQLMTDNDIAALTLMVDHEDEAIRRSATPAVVLLADPRSVAPLLGILQTSRNENGQFNSALVLVDLFNGTTDSALRQQIADGVRQAIETVGPKTRDVLTPVLLVTTTPDIFEKSIGLAGWLYTGVAEGEPWNGALLSWKGVGQTSLPSPGDELTAATEINIRSDIIRFDEKLGFVNAEAIGILPKDGVFVVEKAVRAESGYIWVFGKRTR